MIKEFADRETERVFGGRHSRKPSAELHRIALRKLLVLDAAVSLDTLRVPPGNRLEALKHDRAGQHSIRMDQQWRTCLVWRDGDAYRVEITDHH